MGKNYYCEYCDKRMKNDLNVRKKHIEGLPHKIAKAEYMAPYRNPKELLEEELSKGPCEFFHSGKMCTFGLYCHFSHYTREQLDELSKLAQSEENKRYFEGLGGGGKYRKAITPGYWKYPKKIPRELYDKMPPSLQPIIFNNISSEIHEWG